MSLNKLYKPQFSNKPMEKESKLASITTGITISLASLLSGCTDAQVYLPTSPKYHAVMQNKEDNCSSILDSDEKEIPTFYGAVVELK
jgi:hypothetical protein